MARNPQKDWNFKPDPDKKEECVQFLLTGILIECKLSNEILLKILKSNSDASIDEIKAWYENRMDRIQTSVALELAAFGDVDIPPISPLSEGTNDEPPLGPQ